MEMQAWLLRGNTRSSVQKHIEYPIMTTRDCDKQSSISFNILSVDVFGDRKQYRNDILIPRAGSK